ncbi:MAG: 2-nitropropane dioxygenase [Nitrospinae bacterium CG11_big_fil_rev_8_21_14_0_20_56_8]|nr:MAG: 2-nitropropane dioxygenase [Nitrospinae bacterium CG11_big_fil_rev_8_21_14_0_20_56_8]
MASDKLLVICPCCETRLKVDRKTGDVISEERKEKPRASLSDMVKGLDAQAREQADLFKRNSQSQKERERILAEKFKEAQKNVDKSTDLPLRDIDLD